jgi:hypothetical protein
MWLDCCSIIYLTTLFNCINYIRPDARMTELWMKNDVEEGIVAYGKELFHNLPDD